MGGDLRCGHGGRGHGGCGGGGCGGGCRGCCRRTRHPDRQGNAERQGGQHPPRPRRENTVHRCGRLRQSLRNESTGRDPISSTFALPAVMVGSPTRTRSFPMVP
ncbi:hypothetical protein D1871_07085 [Nakamurella silvestris]|nr:hypothetical protein D1871_07085 [Nakamurella silvestris]